MFKTASDNRPWCLEHAVMPLAVFDDDQVKIHHVRRFLVDSNENRRKVGKEFDFVTATMGQLELLCVIADERDTIHQRAVVRKEKLLRFPIQLPPKDAQALFAALLRDANELRRKPQTYHLLDNNCISNSNLVRHAVPKVFGAVDRATLVAFPAYADVTLRRVGLVDDSLSLFEQREQAEVNE